MEVLSLFIVLVEVMYFLINLLYLNFVLDFLIKENIIENLIVFEIINAEDTLIHA